MTQALSTHPQPAADQVQRRALLATSELVANAVRHARMPVDLEVRRTDAGWVVAVTDGDRTAPIAREVDHLAENGRGLLIVRRSSDRAGWAPAGEGKTVWVELYDTAQD